MYLRIAQVSYLVMLAMLAMMLVFLSLERYQCSSACVSYSEKDPTADLGLTYLWNNRTRRDVSLANFEFGPLLKEIILFISHG